MEQIQAQVRVLADEINLLKGEIVNVKGSHATMHQTSVDAVAVVKSLENRVQDIARRAEETARRSHPRGERHRLQDRTHGDGQAQ